MEIRVIDEPLIRELLPPETCIEVVDETMREVSRGNVELPLRRGMKLPNGNGVLGMMPGYLGAPECFGIKLVSLFPGNHAAGLPSHLGLMVLYEALQGKPIAILDGNVITGVRTAAASAVATRALARADAAKLAVLGTGDQAREHIPAILAVRDIREIALWGRDHDKATVLAEALSEVHRIPITASVKVGTAVEDADIICTVTSTREPILNGAWIPAGAHVNLVGSSVPNAREVDTAAVLRGRFFVDYRTSTLNQAGELLTAMNEGAVDENHIVGEIGELLLGEVEGRQSLDEITIYKSLGIAAQDLAAAWHVYTEAAASGQGQVVQL
jgi:ornithine cyclodeaminase